MSVSQATYEAVMKKCNYACTHCKGRSNVELHHRMPKSKRNRKKFSLFIDSECNLVPLCGGMGNNCHESKKHLYRISDREAEVFEKELSEGKE